MTTDCPDCDGEGSGFADCYSHAYGHYTIDVQCERCNGRGKIEREESGMNAEELIEHCNQIAAHMRQIRGEPADRLVHIPLGPVSQNRYEQLRSINLPGVAVRHALYNLERPRTGLVPMLMLIFDHVEVSVTGEPDYGEAA